MNEIRRGVGPEIKEPEFTPAQLAIKKLCGEILLHTPKRKRSAQEEVFSTALIGDVVGIQRRLQLSSLGDLLLHDGDSLGAALPSEYQTVLDLGVGDTELEKVSVKASLWEYDKLRTDPRYPDQSPPKLVRYAGQKDWTNRLEIRLYYNNNKYKAIQKLTTFAVSTTPGVLQPITRDVSSSANAEMGYSGHNQVSRYPHNDAEIIGFVALAREIFAGRST